MSSVNSNRNRANGQFSTTRSLISKQQSVTSTTTSFKSHRTGVSKGSRYAQDSLKFSHAHASKLATPWCLDYKFEVSSVPVPVSLAFKDYRCSEPKRVLDLRGFMVNSLLMEVVRNDCSEVVRTILLDDCDGLTPQCIQALRGLPELRTLSLVRAEFLIDASIAAMIGSFKMLVNLNISDCDVRFEAFRVLSHSAVNVKTLNASRCTGLEDFSLRAIGQWIQKHRRLEKIDLSECPDLGDNGVIDLIAAGLNVLVSINLSGCRGLSSAALASLRNRNPALKQLRLAHLPMVPTAYEWITEGCRAITILDISRTPTFLDDNLAKIGRYCSSIQLLNIADCIEITDDGIKRFFDVFEGSLESLDLSGCIKCGSGTATVISEHATELQSLKLNGLARIEASSLTLLWNAATELREFEMCSHLKTTTTHRRSMMPHFSDAVVTALQSPAATLQHMKLVGAFQVTDIGACIIVKQCGQLQSLDVSYCHGISDLLLEAMASYAVRLTTFIGSGCINITTRGIQALSTGCCAHQLQRLELNGCSKIMDAGIRALANCTALQSLAIRSCDHTTDSPLLEIARCCRELVSLDISNLDYVGLPVLEAFSEFCPNMKKLSAENCNFTPDEFYQLLKPRLPFANPCKAQCKLEPYPKPIVRFNKYVQQLRVLDNAARKIQRFSRFVITTFLLRLAKKMKRKRFLDTQRAFNALKTAIYKQGAQNRLIARHQAAADLQYCMRRCFAVRLAVRQRHQLRRRRDARLLLQRCFRGFCARQRYHRMLRRLAIYCNYIGHIVHKYSVISAARRLHRQILAVQGFARMIPHRQRYLTFHFVLLLLQRRWHRYQQFVNRKRSEEQQRIAEDQRVYALQNAAARVLQRNWKGTWFNKCMAPYILTCCIYWRTEDDENQWYSTILQRYWRGYSVRLKNWRRSDRYRLLYQSASRIAAAVRRHYAQRRYKKLLPCYQRVLVAWKRFLHPQMPRLRLGSWVRRIQRCGLLYLFRQMRHAASTEIQRVVRGRLHRHVFSELVLAMHSTLAAKIQRAYRKHFWKSRRFEMFARQRMAAYKIGTKAESFFIPIRRQVAKAEASKKQLSDTYRHKKELQMRKRLRILAQIRERYHNVMATRIQNKYREYREEKLRKAKANSLSAKGFKKTASLKEISARSSKKIVPKAPKISNPLTAVKKAIATIPNPFGNVDLIQDHERDRLENAVLKYQIKSILQEGIVNMRLTLGDLEYKTFEVSQRQLANNHLPHFVKVTGDLSGSLALQMFLWAEFGSGRECICQMHIEAKPLNTSQAGMKARTQRLADEEYIKIAWHPHISFEVQGVCSVKQGKGDFAIQAVKITETEPESDALELEGVFTMVKDLSEFGMHAKVWASSRRLMEEENLYKYSQAATNDWWDDRLFRIAKGFALLEADIFRLRSSYEEILARRQHPHIKIAELFIAIDYPYNQIARWIVEAIQTASTKELRFSEYVHLLAFFIMFSAKNLDRFLFQQMDVDHKDYLRRDQFSALMEILAEGSPFNVKVWQYQWDQYFDKKLGFMFITHFEAFLHQNPGALWQAQSLQRKMMKYALGANYWEKKMEQYRIIRKELNIKLL